MYSRLVLSIALLWPLSMVQGQELLLLTFTEGPVSTGRVYGTKKATATPTLSVQDGRQVTLQKSSGRDYKMQASTHGWSWGQVQQVPANATSITVTPRLQGDTVAVDVNYSSWDGDEHMSYNGTVSGNIGQWIPLLQSAASANVSGSRVYSTGTKSDQLSLKVERAR